jgi:DNA-directed RNA polymerase subunit RPC12/RpoP
MTADPARHIWAKRPRCRTCGSADLIAVRTLCRDGDDGGGAVTRYVRCRRCGGRYVLTLD